MNHRCKLCGSEAEVIHHPKIADYHYCSNCEFISKDDRHIVSKEEELKIYNKHNNSIEDPRYVEFFYKFLNDAVFPYTTGGNQGFDFGSGPSPVLAQILERHHNYQMDIYDLFYSPEKVYIGKKYDLVTSTEVVEHLKDPIEHFELFANLLKPNGILAVMTLFHHNDSSHFLNWHYIRDWSHISFYTPKTMEYIASRVGLKIIHTNDIRYTTFMLDH
ncbi:class I SAM-dependent methyltransferase [Proteiniclasticum sp. C24MP]|uniref:class I SAM-dependent methyltransferase n=1 Tax=Proteiniclasticum sp. C24MP TaxID=3374101 RepID=UPI003753F0F0